jgi:hypothetical protein
VDLDLPNDGDLDWVIGHDRMATRQGSAAQGQVHVGDLATQRLGSSVDNSSNGMAARSKLTHVDFLGGGSTIMGLVSAFFLFTFGQICSGGQIATITNIFKNFL